MAFGSAGILWLANHIFSPSPSLLFLYSVLTFYVSLFDFSFFIVFIYFFITLL